MPPKCWYLGQQHGGVVGRCTVVWTREPAQHTQVTGRQPAPRRWRLGAGQNAAEGDGQVGTIVLIVIIVLVLLMLRRR
jgi:hypothetical protein